MSPDDLAKRAEASARLCDAQGFPSTAQALRDLAEELKVSSRLIDRLHDARLQQGGAGSSQS